MDVMVFQMFALHNQKIIMRIVPSNYTKQILEDFDIFKKFPL